MAAALVRRADAGAGSGDVAACREIYAWYVARSAVSLEETAPDLEEMRRRVHASLAHHDWLVAEVDGTIAGYAYGGVHRSRPGYRFTTEVSVYVAPGRERQGLGRTLYEPLLASLEQRGYRLALAGVTLPNPGSVGLHERLGFTHVATFPRIGWKLGSWHDTGWWALALGDDGPPEEISAEISGAPPG